MKRKKSVREAVLDAAAALVEGSGAGVLTLDAVAARAGVSKGGLLHHFKSKEALLTAMMARTAEAFETDLQAATLRLSSNAGNTVEHETEIIETYLDRAFSGLGSRNRSANSLFAVAAHQPSLLQPIRDYYARRTQETLAHSGNATAVLAIMAFADGLWLFDALGIPPLTGRAREEVRQAMKQWARDVLEASGSAPAADKRGGKRSAK
jgi:AcrR family transcriptional regulator